MGRITIRSNDGGVLGWFDPDTATEYTEAREWDGNNHISVPTGNPWDHQALYRTSGGRWVLEHSSNWKGKLTRYEYLSDEAAQEWLVLNEHDAAITEHFGELEAERGPGRPEVGKPINIRLGAKLLSAVDQAREVSGQSRADLLRDLVSQALAARQDTAERA